MTKSGKMSALDQAFALLNLTEARGPGVYDHHRHELFNKNVGMTCTNKNRARLKRAKRLLMTAKPRRMSQASRQDLEWLLGRINDLL